MSYYYRKCKSRKHYSKRKTDDLTLPKININDIDPELNDANHGRMSKEDRKFYRKMMRKYDRFQQI